MKLITPPPEVARAGLRALKTVAMSDGELHPLERALIDAVKTHVLRVDVDLDELVGITPEDLAAAVPSPEFRRRILNGCALLALMDGEAAAAERAVLDAFADALGIDDAALTAIRHYAEGRMRLVRFDVARRFVAVDRVKKTLRDQGLRGLLALARDLLRRSEDTALAERYRRLEQLAPETLGRQYVDFCRAAGFPLPGEVGAAPDVIVFHDCHHVLCGYGTSPEEEAQLAAFHAGTNREDPFGMLLFAIMQFHLGVAITPSAEGYTGKVDPERLARAFVRGTQVTADLIRTWEPREDFETPVDELRARFGIVPR